MKDKAHPAERVRFDMVAKTMQGLETELEQELRQLGATDIRVLRRALRFRGNKALMYRANLWLRTALRVYKPFHYFKARSDQELYQRIKQFNWARIMEADQTFAIDYIVHSRFFKHSKFAALRTKDAICDQFRAKLGKRPSIDLDQPDYKIQLHIKEEHCQLSLDSSGESLHKRSYRLDGQEAPLNEVLAAGLLRLSGWKPEQLLLDPMCGSGTILIEAALMGRNRPPGINRHFGFERWRDFDQDLWQRILKESVQHEQHSQLTIYGYDRSARALRAAAANMQRAGVSDCIELKEVRFEESTAPPGEAGVLIINPPYGERLKENDLLSLYREMGNRLKHHYSGYTAWVFSANKEALKSIGLQTSKRLSLYNGPLETKFHRYEMFRGPAKPPSRS